MDIEAAMPGDVEDALGQDLPEGGDDEEVEVERLESGDERLVGAESDDLVDVAAAFARQFGDGCGDEQLVAAAALVRLRADAQEVDAAVVKQGLQDRPAKTARGEVVDAKRGRWFGHLEWVVAVDGRPTSTDGANGTRARRCVGRGARPAKTAAG